MAVSCAVELRRKRLATNRFLIPPVAAPDSSSPSEEALRGAVNLRLKFTLCVLYKHLERPWSCKDESCQTSFPIFIRGADGIMRILLGSCQRWTFVQKTKL